MFSFITQNKLLTGGTLAVVLVLLYYFFFMSSAPLPALSTSGMGELPATQDLLITLSSLHTIRLDGSIFSDPAFISLTDFGVVIPPESVGRRNPFAPLSGQAGLSGGGAATPSNLKLPTSGQ